MRTARLQTKDAVAEKKLLIVEVGKHEHAS